MVDRYRCFDKAVSEPGDGIFEGEGHGGGWNWSRFVCWLGFVEAGLALVDSKAGGGGEK